MYCDFFGSFTLLRSSSVKRHVGRIPGRDAGCRGVCISVQRGVHLQRCGGKGAPVEKRRACATGVSSW